MRTTTVYLRKGAGRVRVARGPHAVELTPGEYADVPDQLLDAVLASGAVKRSRPDGQDADTPAGATAEEE